MNSLYNGFRHVLAYAFGSDTVEYQGITLPAKALRALLGRSIMMRSISCYQRKKKLTD